MRLAIFLASMVIAYAVNPVQQVDWFYIAALLFAMLWFLAQDIVEFGERLKS